MLYHKFRQAKAQEGFSLIEMAIVLVILGFLLGGLITPLSSQREISQRQTAERQLQEIRSAILGFAQVNNRLPCPAAPNSNGVESRLFGPPLGPCLNPFGVLPFQALGIQGIIINGNLVDPWNVSIQYRLTNVSSPTTTWAYSKAPVPISPTAPNLPNIRICNPRTCSAAAVPTQIIATNVVAVVFSTGPDGPDIPGTASPDQLENTDPDYDFVMRANSGGVRTGIEFDDIVVWISQSTLSYEVSRAGQ
jgi:prepilin-type N-terminal cleavage/methylation domain-containing protein